MFQEWVDKFWIVVDWLVHFAKHAKSNSVDPMLPILDYCSSHILISSYNACKENIIYMVSLSRHTSDHRHRLYVTFFTPSTKHFIENKNCIWPILTIKELPNVMWMNFKEGIYENALIGKSTFQILNLRYIFTGSR